MVAVLNLLYLWLPVGLRVVVMAFVGLFILSFFIGLFVKLLSILL